MLACFALWEGFFLCLSSPFHSFVEFVPVNVCIFKPCKCMYFLFLTVPSNYVKGQKKKLLLKFVFYVVWFLYSVIYCVFNLYTKSCLDLFTWNKYIKRNFFEKSVERGKGGNKFTNNTECYINYRMLHKKHSNLQIQQFINDNTYK